MYITTHAIKVQAVTDVFGLMRLPGIHADILHKVFYVGITKTLYIGYVLFKQLVFY
jgi:hypothetical protein